MKLLQFLRSLFTTEHERVVADINGVVDDSAFLGGDVVILGNWTPYDDLITRPWPLDNGQRPPFATRWYFDGLTEQWRPFPVVSIRTGAHDQALVKHDAATCWPCQMKGVSAELRWQ